MGKLKVAVFSGGFSGEAGISKESAEVIMNNIDQERYDVFQVEVDSKGWVSHYKGTKKLVDQSDFSILEGEKKLHFDFALIMIHGTPGEDGILQSYMEELNIPHSTGDSILMGLTFDKEDTQKLLKEKGFSVAKNIALHNEDPVDPELIAMELGIPCFIKPTRAGSSLGITKVKTLDDIVPAVEKARKEFKNVLIESFLDGREITCGVYRNGKSIVALPITEIIPANDFFDFESKYQAEATQEITPAEIPLQIWDECQRQSKFIYEELNCRGFIRVDYMLVKDELFVIELNTVPGFTEKSLIPQQLVHAGINIKDFITQIIETNLVTKAEID